jgi:hypothetical protein
MEPGLSDKKANSTMSVTGNNGQSIDAAAFLEGDMRFALSSYFLISNFYFPNRSVCLCGLPVLVAAATAAGERFRSWLQVVRRALFHC